MLERQCKQQADYEARDLTWNHDNEFSFGGSQGSRTPKRTKAKRSSFIQEKMYQKAPITVLKSDCLILICIVMIYFHQRSQNSFVLLLNYWFLKLLFSSMKSITLQQSLLVIKSDKLSFGPKYLIQTHVTYGWSGQRDVREA